MPLSADEEIPKGLLQEGPAVGGSRFVYATDRLVLWNVQPGLAGDKDAVLNSGKFERLAYANSVVSPYGSACIVSGSKLNRCQNE